MLGFNKKSKTSQPPPAEAPDPLAVEKSGEVAIHVMPQNFRSSSAGEVSKMTGILVLLGGFAVLVVLFGAGYYFFFARGDGQSAVLPEEQAATSTQSADPAEKLNNLNNELENKDDEKIESGKALAEYLKFRTAVSYISDLDDYEQLLKDYASSNYNDNWSVFASRLDQVSDEDIDELIELLKGYQPPKVALEDRLQEKSANTSMVLLKMRSGFDEFSATMAQENGEWKVDKETGVYYEDQDGSTTTLEKWLLGIGEEEKPPAQDELDKKLLPGQDSDNDGLTDKEEQLIGTDSSTSDSDGDSYQDQTEFMNLFNPAGTGKINENANIKEYYNPTFGYRIIYPSFWSMETIGGNDSIIIKTLDNQFVQIIVTPNPARAEIEEWYKEQFSRTEVNYNSLIEKKDESGNTIWRGIKNESGLTVYLTGSDKEYIYTFSYNIGQGNTLDYINMFNAMIKSLSF